MGTVSLHGVCDMHVHTNPDLRLRAYDDFELADAAVRVGAKAIVIKSHLGFTVNRAYLTNQYVNARHDPLCTICGRKYTPHPRGLLQGRRPSQRSGKEAGRNR